MLSPNTNISGTIKSILFHDQVTGCGIFKTTNNAVIRGVSHNAGIGKRIYATGEIVTHPKHGR